MNQVESIENIKKHIEDICKDENISQIYDEAEYIIETIYDRNLYNGRSRDAMISGIVYALSKKNNLTFTVDDISDMFGVNKRSVILSEKYISNNIEELKSLPQDWNVYIDSYCDSLNINDKICKLSKDIGKKGESNCIHSGRKPQIYAAGCIYAAYKYSDTKNVVTQRQLSDIAGTSESSIRITYNNLLDNYKKDD